MKSLIKYIKVLVFYHSGNLSDPVFFSGVARGLHFRAFTGRPKLPMGVQIKYNFLSLIHSCTGSTGARLPIATPLIVFLFIFCLVVHCRQSTMHTIILPCINCTYTFYKADLPVFTFPTVNLMYRLCLSLMAPFYHVNNMYVVHT